MLSTWAMIYKFSWVRHINQEKSIAFKKLTKAAAGGVLCKKGKVHRKTSVLEFFPVNFQKLLTRPFLQNISGRLLLRFYRIIQIGLDSLSLKLQLDKIRNFLSSMHILLRPLRLRPSCLLRNIISADHTQFTIFVSMALERTICKYSMK